MAITCTAITTSNTTIYTSSGTNAITTIIVCNTNVYDPMNPTVGATTLSLYVVPGGGTPTNTNLIVNQLNMPAGETFTFDNERMVLSSTDKIVAVAGDPSCLVATVSSLVVV